MNDKDYAISPVGSVINTGVMLKKPPHLITFEKGKQKFLTIEKPEFGASFLQTKGIFTELSDEEILSSFNEIIAQAPSESIVEMYFPISRINSVKNLVFRAKTK